MLIALMIQIITQFCFIYIYKTTRIDDRFKLVKMKSVKVERGKRGKWRSRIRYRGCQTRFFLFLIHIQRALTRKIQFIKSLLHRRMWSACVINGEKRRARQFQLFEKYSWTEQFTRYYLILPFDPLDMKILTRAISILKRFEEIYVWATTIRKQ